MRTIKLTQGQIALVDDEDFDLVSQYKWHASKFGNNFYVVTSKKCPFRRLHQLIMNGRGIDHINGDTLDNRRSNLRFCNHSQNGGNRRKSKGCSSRFKGVYWYKAYNEWMAYINIEKKRIHLGYFDIEENAARAYDKAALELFGEFAKLNFPENKIGD